jgi:hypothetical protein
MNETYRPADKPIKGSYLSGILPVGACCGVDPLAFNKLANL